MVSYFYSEEEMASNDVEWFGGDGMEGGGGKNSFQEKLVDVLLRLEDGRRVGEVHTNWQTQNDEDIWIDSNA